MVSGHPIPSFLRLRFALPLEKARACRVFPISRPQRAAIRGGRVDAVDDGAGHGAAGGRAGAPSPRAVAAFRARARQADGGAARVDREPSAGHVGVARREHGGGGWRVVLEFPREHPELPRGRTRGGDVRGDHGRRGGSRGRGEPRHHRRNARKRVREPAERSGGLLVNRQAARGVPRGGQDLGLPEPAVRPATAAGSRPRGPAARRQGARDRARALAARRGRGREKRRHLRFPRRHREIARRRAGPRAARLGPLRAARQGRARRTRESRVERGREGEPTGRREGWREGRLRLLWPCSERKRARARARRPARAGARTALPALQGREDASSRGRSF